MIIAKTHHWADDRTCADLVIDSQPDGTFKVRWGNVDVGVLNMEGRTLTGTIQGSRIVASEIADDNYPVKLGAAALGLVEAAMHIARQSSKTIEATLDGSTITITRDGDVVGEFNPASYYGSLGWKGKLLGRAFSPNVESRVRRLLDEFEARLKKALNPDWFIRDTATGAFYKSYGVDEAVVKASDKAQKAILKQRDAGFDRDRSRLDWGYLADYQAETQRLLQQHCVTGRPLLFNMTDPKKGPVGAKKFKRFSDAKMHLLYLVGHFVPSKSARADGWPDDYDDVPEFLANYDPIKVPESWEIVEIASKGAEPKVVMSAAEIQDWLARHSRLKVLTDRYGAVVKGVYSKLEKDSKVESFPYVLVLGADDKGKIDEAIGNFGIAKKSFVKVRGKENWDGERKIAIATGDVSTAFLLRSALSDELPTQVLDMRELTEVVAAGD